MLRSLILVLLAVNALVTGALCLQWSLTGEVPELLNMAFPVGSEARAIAGVAKQYYMFAVIGISYGHIFGGLAVLFVALIGNSASKAAAALAFFIADTIAIVCHIYFPGQWTPAPLEPARFIRYGSCALSLIAILAGGSRSHRAPKDKSS